MTRLSLQSTFTATFQRTAASYPHRPALSTPDGPVITWGEYAERVRTIATGLAALGIGRGDTVGLMLTNRPEFHLVDTAVLHTGATPFSIYNTLAPEQIAHLFGNAGNRVVVCEEQFVERIRTATASAETAVEHIVCVGAEVAGAITLAELETRTADGFDFTASWRAVEPDDTLTIIYTSGTTGPPKGVEITHAGMRAEIESMTEISTVTAKDSIISYLPDAHIANRWGCHYSSIASGMHVITLAELRGLVEALPKVRPTLFGAVPQVWYRVKAGIDAQLAAERSPLKRRIAAWAFAVGTERVRRRSDRRPVPRLLDLQAEIAERLVFAKVRQRLGLDHVKYAATGAAAIDPEALAFVLALGLPCCEIWGMSELSCAATTNRPDDIRIGTVGKAISAAELRLADDGELLVRGPLVMKGYRNEPEKTAETIDSDGWLHTGDIASIDDQGYVRIVDRKKELMINAAGKNMSPANIEGIVKVSCPLVGSVVVIGDDRPYVVALLTLDPDAAATFARAHGITDTSTQTLAEHPAVRAELEQGIKVANDRLARVEQIRRFEVLGAVWEPGGDEVTPTMKIKRRPIAAKYAAQIDALYTRS